METGDNKEEEMKAIGESSEEVKGASNVEKSSEEIAPIASKVIEVNVDEEMKKSFMAYAMAVNVSRAIPDVRDGLKPVHRRILYAMSEMGLWNTSGYKKCARIVGDVLGKYHPHGDSSVYDALVRLAQDFSIRCPLVDGHGNFGSVDGDPAAAYRYTEARLSKISDEMLRDIDKDSVDFYPNFDESLMQPTVLPSRFPNLLVNGSDGIAVGMATNIPPHNLGEVIDGVVALINNPEISIDELMDLIPAPDYPTGGIIMGNSAVKHAYKTGKGGVILRAKTDIVEENGRYAIVVTELPYQVNKSKLIIQIADLVKSKKIEGIADIKEESDRDGMRIVIDVKRDANAQVVLNLLFKHTNLQVSNGIILLALAGKTPQLLNLKQILEYYLEHQRDVITRRTQYDLKKAQEKEHIIEGLVKALANIDEVIKTIKSADDKQDACIKLIEKFELDEIQANAILEMKLQKLTSLEVEKLKKELEDLEHLIIDLNDILARPERRDSIIVDEITEIKRKYNTPRRTEISIDYGDIDLVDLIPKEEVVITMTHEQYIKRMPVAEYKSQRRGGKGVVGHKPKELDFVENMLVCSSHDQLLFLTNLGRIYSLFAYEIPEAQKTAKGRAMINMLPLNSGEKVSAFLKRPEGEDDKLVMVTKRGVVKRIEAKHFENIYKAGKIAILLREGDELIGVRATDGNKEILIATHKGRCIKFKEEKLRLLGRSSSGVRGVTLNGEDDYVVDMDVVNDGDIVVTVSEFGIGKRLDTTQIRLTTRGGKGVYAGRFNASTGKLVALKKVQPDNDILIVTSNGVVIRTSVATISAPNRLSKGVILMNTKGKTSVVCVAVTEKEEFDESENADDLGENGEDLGENAIKNNDGGEGQEVNGGENFEQLPSGGEQEGDTSELETNGSDSITTLNDMDGVEDFNE